MDITILWRVLWALRPFDWLTVLSVAGAGLAGWLHAAATGFYFGCELLSVRIFVIFMKYLAWEPIFWFSVGVFLTIRWRRVRDALLWFGTTGQVLPNQTIRSEFNNTPLLAEKVSIHHTHGVAAANRSTAVTFMRHVADRVGLQYYSVQASASDERHGVEGSRTYYWAKDMIVQPAVYQPQNRALLAMVDVDYYMDMNDFLVNAERPVIMYTFVPERAAGCGDGYVWHVDNESQVHMSITGGGQYTHRLWDYGYDNVMAVEWFLYIIPWKVVSYLVDRRRVAADRYVVLFTPIASWRYPLSLLAWLSLSGPRVKRMVLAVGDWVRLKIVAQGGVKISTARVNTTLCCTVPVEIDDAIAAIARISRTELSLPQVQSLVDKKVEAVVLVEYHRLKTKHLPPVVFPVTEGVRSYQVLMAPYDPNAKPSLIAFMSPIIHGAFAPMQTPGNEAYSIRKRVDEVKSTAEMTPFTLRCCREFVERVVPMPHHIHPVDQDEVFARQARPMQRSLLNLATLMFKPFRIIRMFLKKEAYPGVKAPRPISQMNPRDNLEYSAFLYAVAEHLKMCRWYAFGKTPLETAEAVAAVCVHAEVVLMTDFNKMDGHVSKVSRELEQMIMVRLFHPEHHAVMLELMRGQYGLDGVSRLGIKYKTGFARASGSSETSAFNTLTNAFVSFVALRMEGLNADDAYQGLGLYGGDDGIAANVSCEKMARAARAVGQEVEGKVVKRGSFGVKFLARYYSPEVWNGGLDSCADVRRQLVKFHTTTSLPSYISPKIKLVEKAESYYMTDKNTPILGELVTLIHQMHLRDAEYAATQKVRQEGAHVLKNVGYYHGKVSADYQYPNENGMGWMEAVIQQDLPQFNRDVFTNFLERCATLEQIMRPPLCEGIRAPEAIDEKVVVDGDVIERKVGVDGVKLPPPMRVVGGLSVHVAPRPPQGVSPTSPVYEPTSPQVPCVSPTVRPPTPMSSEAAGPVISKRHMEDSNPMPRKVARGRRDRDVTSVRGRQRKAPRGKLPRGAKRGRGK